MPPQSLIPRRVLMTADAVGGVWRYAMDLAASLQTSNVQFLIVGVGPRPTAAAQAELRFLDNVEVVWTDTSLDWMAERRGPGLLSTGHHALGTEMVSRPASPQPTQSGGRPQRSRSNRGNGAFLYANLVGSDGGNGVARRVALAV